jgi:hypothetical protein
MNTEEEKNLVKEDINAIAADTSLFEGMVSAKQLSAQRRNLIILGTFILIASIGIFYIPIGAKVPFNPVLLLGTSFLLLGILLASSLYKIAPFLKELSYKAGVKTALILFALVVIAIILVHYFRHAISIPNIAFYSSLFLVPYAIYQSWLFYKIAFRAAQYKPWNLSDAPKNKNAISLFLNSLQLTIKLAPTPELAERQYDVTMPGIKTVGNMFSELIYSEVPGFDKQKEFADIINNQYDWFFFKPGFMGMGLRQLDTELSLLDNGIKNNGVIIARRA